MDTELEESWGRVAFGPSSRLPVRDRKIHDAYYKTSDGIHSLSSAVSGDPATRNDKVLLAVVSNMKDELEHLWNLLHAGYEWD